MMKTCNDCLECLPVSEFFVYKNGYLNSYCKKCHSKRSMKWRKENPEKVRASLAYHSEKRKDYREQWRLERRALVLTLLGDCCAQCGFSDSRALQIDHINGGGNKERIQMKSNTKLYTKILSFGTYGYQLLCANCNWIKRVENKEYRSSSDNGDQIKITPTITLA